MRPGVAECSFSAKRWAIALCYNENIKTVGVLSDFCFGNEFFENEEECQMAKAVVDAGTCVACEACVGTCPVEAIAMTDGKAKVNPDTCIECGSCVSACPVSAISQ